MKLREKLSLKKPLEKLVTIDGDGYLLIALSRVPRTQLLIDSQDAAGKQDRQEFDRLLISRSVYDPEDRQRVFADDEQCDIPGHVVSELIPELLRLNRFAILDEDIEKKD